MAKRRLTDLFVVGKEVVVDDGSGAVTVYMKKLNPVDHDKALKRANAERSKIMSIRKSPGSEEYEAQWSAVLDYDIDDLIEYLVQDFRSQREQVVHAEMAAEEEWSKDSYLDGLEEAWREGLDKKYASDPEDPDALRVYNEIDRFEKAVEEEINKEVENKRLDFKSMGEEKLREEVFDKFLSLQASLAWVSEYRRSEVWLATKETDKKTPYFTSRSEIDDLAGEVFRQLSNAYQNLAVEPLEGKDSQGTDTSSSSSDQQGSQATEALSGL